MRTAAIVLCGGRSRRFGRPKWDVEIAGRSMLDRVLEAVGGCDVVALSVSADAKNQPASRGLLTVPDPTPDDGPLSGLQATWQAVQTQTSTRYDALVLVSCDVPLLRLETIDRWVHQWQIHDDDALIPRADGHVHPLTAVYRADALTRVLTRDTRSARVDMLVSHLRCRFTDVDPQIVFNVNTADDCVAAESFLHVESRG